MDHCWSPTRAAGLARLHAFIPRAGSRYAGGRNFDPGPAGDANVSRLSPYVRHRLVGEPELIAAAIAAHGDRADKFVQQVFWRFYWKGWLEARPSVWLAYLREVARAQYRIATETGLSRTYRDATAGASGIACFDTWAHELVATGYLHHRARMWFASIWTFTLRIPWALGAAFFLQHLLDGDPAANILSWRWVVGLHSPGKAHVARAADIARYTCGRFNPAGQLNEDPAPLTGCCPVPPPLTPAPAAPPHGDVALLLHEDDCWPETLPLAGMRVRAVAGLLPAGAVAPPVAAFAEGAVRDAVRRATHRCDCPGTTITSAGLTAWMDGIGLPVVMPWPPVGSTADSLANHRIARLLRPFDAAAWRHATCGFFQFRDRIPELIGVLRESLPVEGHVRLNSRCPEDDVG